MVQPGFGVHIFSFNHQDKIDLSAASFIIPSGFSYRLPGLYRCSFAYTYPGKIAVCSKIPSMTDSNSHSVAKIIYSNNFAIKNRFYCIARLCGNRNSRVIPPQQCPFNIICSEMYTDKTIINRPGQLTPVTLKTGIQFYIGIRIKNDGWFGRSCFDPACT